MRSNEKDRGAAAVEFALMFPLVIMLLIAIFEFSRLWNVQATMADGARLSARYAAVHGNGLSGAALDPIKAAAATQATEIPGLVDWTTATIVIEVDCDVAGVATSEITYAPGSVTQWFGEALGNPIELISTGKMPCGG